VLLRFNFIRQRAKKKKHKKNRIFSPFFLGVLGPRDLAEPARGRANSENLPLWQARDLDIRRKGRRATRFPLFFSP